MEADRDSFRDQVAGLTRERNQEISDRDTFRKRVISLASLPESATPVQRLHPYDIYQSYAQTQRDQL